MLRDVLAGTSLLGSSEILRCCCVCVSAVSLLLEALGLSDSASFAAATKMASIQAQLMTLTLQGELTNAIEVTACWHSRPASWLSHVVRSRRQR